MNPTTLLIHQLAGPIFIMVGVSFLLNKAYFMKLIKELTKMPVLPIFSMVVNLFVGILILLKHNQWDTLPEIVATLIGIIAIVKGVSMGLAPDANMKWVQKTVTPKFVQYYIPFAFVVGAYMTWVGYLA